MAVPVSKPCAARGIYSFAMGRLYWKIFLGFWAVAVVVAVATSMTTNLLSDRDAPRRFDLLNQLRLESSTVTARVLLQQGGVPALRDWLEAQGRNSGPPLWVIGPDGKDLLGRHVPPRALERLRSGRRVAGHMATAAVRYKGERFLLALPAPDIRRLAPPRRPLRLLGLAVAVVVSGFVCWLLAGYLTRPLRQLQVASRRLGAGERGVRVAQAVGRRRDEIGELGSEFNHMAEQLERSMDAQAALLRDVSHELRSPLARLRVALDLARRRAGGGGGAEAELDRIELEAGRLDTLIGQLLEMIRMRAGDQSVASETIELRAMLAAIVDDADFEAAADGRSVTGETGEPVTLRGDPVLLGRAFENVIRNAVLHTAENTAVEVALVHAADTVVVSVRDHGPGVPEAVLTRLFDPFFRVEEARDRATGGHGLGLAIAREAVRLHGGEIWAENAEDGGLRVSVRLPARATAS